MKLAAAFKDYRSKHMSKYKRSDDTDTQLAYQEEFFLKFLKNIEKYDYNVHQLLYDLFLCQVAIKNILNVIDEYEEDDE